MLSYAEQIGTQIKDMLIQYQYILQHAFTDKLFKIYGQLELLDTKFMLTHNSLRCCRSTNKLLTDQVDVLQSRNESMKLV